MIAQRVCGICKKSIEDDKYATQLHSDNVMCGECFAKAFEDEGE